VILRDRPPDRKADRMPSAVHTRGAPCPGGRKRVESDGVIDLDAPRDYVIFGDNASALAKLPDASFQLIYIDPPFNTGSVQQRRTLQTVRDDGTLYFHIDYREAHYCKVLLDMIFGRECFLNEIIWAYDYGGRARDRWPAKHDTILVYVKEPKRHFFDQDAIARIPYMAPGLVSADKAARGKLPTDVWWHTIVATNGKEKTGYPNQKPEGVLRRVLSGSSQPGGRVLDFFAGSGTTASVARQMGRRFVMMDSHPEALATMRGRLGTFETSYLDVDGSALPPGDASDRNQQPML